MAQAANNTKHNKRAYPSDLSHLTSMAAGAAYGVMGTVVNLALSSTALFAGHPSIAVGTLITGMSLNLYAASRTRVPLAGMLSAIFGGVAVAGGLTLGAAIAFNDASAALKLLPVPKHSDKMFVDTRHAERPAPNIRI